MNLFSYLPRFISLGTLLTLTLTVVFWTSDIDIEVAKYFFHPEVPSDPWLEGHWWLWTMIYKQINSLNYVILITGSLLILMAFINSRFQRYKRYGAMVLFSLALGPGLIINLIFKDNTNRPRPIQLIEFGGQNHYNPPLGEAPKQPHKANRSFPCGHCSSGFVLFIGFFIFRQRGQRRLALLSAVCGLLLGSVIGIARMAAGGHYLSDIVWSAYLTFMSCWLVYLAVNSIDEAFFMQQKKGAMKIQMANKS